MTRGTAHQAHIYWSKSSKEFRFREGDELSVNDYIAVDDAVIEINERGKFAAQLRNRRCTCEQVHPG